MLVRKDEAHENHECSVAEKKVMTKGVLGKGKSYVDQIFRTKMLLQEYLKKDKKLCAAFMGSVKAYDRADREAFWKVLKIHGVGRLLMERLKAFYSKTNAPTATHIGANGESLLYLLKSCNLPENRAFCHTPGTWLECGSHHQRRQDRGTAKLC